MTVAIVQDCIFLYSTSMPKHKMLLLLYFFNESNDSEKNMENFVELAEILFIVNALILDLFQSIRQLCNLLPILSGLCADHGTEIFSECEPRKKIKDFILEQVFALC